MESEQLEALVNYSTYHKEKSKKWQQDVSKLDNWSYDETEDTWTCAAGRKLLFHYETKEMTEGGYEVRKRHYRSESRESCPLREACTQAKGNRKISVSLKYLRYKQQAREKLRSEEGYALSVRKMIEPESVFGQMKNNRGFRRFLLRGLPKVSLVVGWLSIAHNLLKKAAIDQKSEMAVQG